MKEDRNFAFLRKTRICRHFLVGQCDLGYNCKFAHDAADLKETPNLRNTALCFSVAKGVPCVRGVVCTYAHSDWELHEAHERLRQTNPALLERIARITAEKQGKLKRVPPNPKNRNAASAQSPAAGEEKNGENKNENPMGNVPDSLGTSPTCLPLSPHSVSNSSSPSDDPPISAPNQALPSPAAQPGAAHCHAPASSSSAPRMRTETSPLPKEEEEEAQMMMMQWRRRSLPATTVSLPVSVREPTTIRPCTTAAFGFPPPIPSGSPPGCVFASTAVSPPVSAAVHREEGTSPQVPRTMVSQQQQQQHGEWIAVLEDTAEGSLPRGRMGLVLLSVSPSDRGEGLTHAAWLQEGERAEWAECHNEQPKQQTATERER
uniref:C3H1-type domain-containing protein n=1 Tax=Chromera velia CCMP2878 TaxID=1169474 RepID=A0A0G4GZS4_9ALVE|eukprot:Cvel_5463.t1-p1 / transcript=Cvel_5463.t1 / gene=Cvel_5463 / organism=Chromera_velia_CCMP2878 / gene_product=hypothetical protein / transcript_product=hypothetical protein / location=Cvel_scaffold255:72569-75729(-) / protein_length=374 / sequence_SO=supercontig / SO=protein_coding / is_pseudo=false